MSSFASSSAAALLVAAGTLVAAEARYAQSSTITLEDFAQSTHSWEENNGTAASPELCVL
jgi:hypothetical protein